MRALSLLPFFSAALAAGMAFLLCVELAGLFLQWRAASRLQERRPSGPENGGWGALIWSRLALALAARLSEDSRQRLEALAEAADSGRGPGELVLQSLLYALLGALHLATMGLGPWAWLGLGLGALPCSRIREQGRLRQKALRRALPQALDLLATSVRAGQSFEQALHRVTPRLSPGPLRQRLEAALAAMRVGQSRAWALQEAASQSKVDELGQAVEAIVTAERRGLPLAAALKSQAARQRALRLAAAQKAAAQAPLKMLFPVMFFILPAVFVVLFAPIFLKMSEMGW